MQIQPINITQIIVAIITTTGIIVNAIYSARRSKTVQKERRKLDEEEKKLEAVQQSKTIQEEKRKLDKEKKKLEAALRNIWKIGKIVMCICLILLVANLVVFVVFLLPIIIPPPDGPTTEVEIIYPYDGATVEIREMVRGTSQNIPKGQVIWILVYPLVTGRYYPQNDPADVQANGNWTSLTLIGIEEDVGEEFDIIAVLADKRAQDTFNAYLTQAKEEKTWPGLEKLPESAEIYDRITVTRG